MVRASRIKLFSLISLVVTLGACVSRYPEAISLFADVESYSSIDANKQKYGLFGVEGIGPVQGESFATIAYSKYKFLSDYEGIVRFLFFEDRLMELHFIYDNYVDVIQEYFPQLKERTPYQDEDGVLLYWFSIDREMDKYYIGIADSRLREEYKKRLSQ